MELAIALVALTLADMAIVDNWMQGSLFEGWRRKVALRKWSYPVCVRCMLHSVPVLLSLLWAIGRPWTLLLPMVIIGLAAGRVAWMINNYARIADQIVFDYPDTPGDDDDIEEDRDRDPVPVGADEPDPAPVPRESEDQA